MTTTPAPDTARPGSARAELRVEEVGPERAADVVAVVHAGFGARAAIQPPSTALQETVETVADALAAHGGVLALRGGRPAGCLLLEPHGALLGLRRVAVHPEHQGYGVAGALVDAAEAVAAERGHTGVRLSARTELPATVRFWQYHGYGEVEHHGTSVVMAKELPTALALPGAADTRAVGARLAPLLRAGDLVVLSGDLGAGKTTLTQGLGEALGVRGPVTSPTFVIARVHPSLRGGPPLVHVDAYRLGGVAEIDDLDLDASLEDAVTVVEWGTGVVEALTEDRLELTLTRPGPGTQDETRSLCVVPVGARWVGSGIAAALRGLA